MKFFAALTFVACLSTVACGDNTGPSSSSGSSSSGSSGAAVATCSVDRGSGAQKYDCPSEAAASKCQSDVTACTPTTRTRGTVAPGQTCDFSDTSELGDNCAPIAKWASSDNQKGASCNFNSSGPANKYCSHGCTSVADCADVKKSGFTTSCSSTGSCSLQ